MFHKASDNAQEEYEARLRSPNKLLTFGVNFLDDALRGIFPDDLILLGAPSGAGKTQLCCNIAYANLEDGKRVHYIALEASVYEIERRLKYPLVLERFYADENRPRLDDKLTFTDWLSGAYANELKPYEESATEFFKKAFQNLFVHYKPEKFGIQNLIESVLYCADDTDLIIIDHVHYFDFDDDNENRAIKEIAKTVRNLALTHQKPILLVAHLRKRDKQNEELVAGLDEFHGSSDLYKIATRVITISPGSVTQDGKYETFFRIPKNRLDGGVTRFIGKELFSPKRGSYEPDSYQVGYATQTRKQGFECIDNARVPRWAKRAAKSVSSVPVHKIKRWND
jgi:archaellum biogenesis ATPase FlaH